MIIKVDPSIIKYEHKIQNLCCVPYYNHPKGCPNFGHKETCPGGPTGLPLIDKVLNLDKDVYIVYTSFDVGIFAERMRQNHPEWKDQPRQWYNCIRWQGTARHNLSEEMKKARQTHNLEIITNSPEAHGIDCSALMKEGAGIILDWQWPPPHDIADESYKDTIRYQIAIGGYSAKRL
jgi:hypothetical protein